MDAMNKEIKDLLGAPGERNPKRKRGAQAGNLNAMKHGIYSRRYSPKELAARESFEADLCADLGSDPPASVRALIKTAGMLFMRLNRCDRALQRGQDIASEHILAWCNSFRLILSAIGLERKTKPRLGLTEYLAAKHSGQEKVAPDDPRVQGDTCH